jgi:hypothetical protein
MSSGSACGRLRREASGVDRSQAGYAFWPISLPDVDGTVLAMFGVGQSAYLTKKAATGIDQ